MGGAADAHRSDGVPRAPRDDLGRDQAAAAARGEKDVDFWTRSPRACRIVADEVAGAQESCAGSIEAPLRAVPHAV